MTLANVPNDQAMAIGEQKTIRFTVTDNSGVNVADFTGWAVAWFLLASATVNGTIAELTASAKLTKTSGAGDIDLSVPPFVDVNIDAADTASFTAGTYFFECWRTDTGNERRLSYGSFPLLN